MGLACNITNTSLLVQKAYGNIRAAEALAAHEAEVYNPQEMSWLMTEGHDYFFRAFRNLGEMSAALLPRVVDEIDVENARYQKSCDLMTQAMELGRLFILSPEKIERRKELLSQMSAGLRAFQGAGIDLFKDFLHTFSDYVTRDIKLYEQPPVIREERLENGMVVIVEETAVYTLIRPKNDEQRTSLFVSVPHNGTQLPPEELALRSGRQGSNQKNRAKRHADVVHSDSDLYLREAWKDVPAQGGTLMIAKIDRFACDLNRTANDVSDLTVIDAPPSKTGKGRDDIVWDKTMSGDVLRERRMTMAALDYRISRWHSTYGARRSEELERLRHLSGSVFLLSAHNCPSEPGKDHADYLFLEGKMRPLFNPGFTNHKYSIRDRQVARTLDGSIPQSSNLSEAHMTLPPEMRMLVIEFFRRKANQYFPELLEGLTGEERDFQACTANFPYGGAGECLLMNYSDEVRIFGFQLELIRALMFNEVSEKHKGDLQKNETFSKLQIIINEFLTECWPELERMMQARYSAGA